MGKEPKYVAQVKQTPFLHPDWLIAERKKAENEGCTFFRYTVHPTDMDVALIEGWEEFTEDLGSPRFIQ